MVVDWKRDNVGRLGHRAPADAHAVPSTCPQRVRPVPAKCPPSVRSHLVATQRTSSVGTSHKKTPAFRRLRRRCVCITPSSHLCGRGLGCPSNLFAIYAHVLEVARNLFVLPQCPPPSPPLPVARGSPSVREVPVECPLSPVGFCGPSGSCGSRKSSGSRGSCWSCGSCILVGLVSWTV